MVATSFVVATCCSRVVHQLLLQNCNIFALPVMSRSHGAPVVLVCILQNLCKLWVFSYCVVLVLLAPQSAAVAPANSLITSCNSFQRVKC